MSALIDAVASLMHRGGPVMWPIAVCSAVTVFVTFQKLLRWAFYRLALLTGAAEWKSRLEALAAGDCAAAAAPAHSPYGRILAAALQRTDLPFAEALTVEAQKLVRNLALGLGVLDTIVTLAPMLGILGTVTGIITSFDLMGSSGVDDPTGIAAGIAEALITTAAGLVVSIAALLPLNAGRTVHKRLVIRLEEAMTVAEKLVEKTRA